MCSIFDQAAIASDDEGFGVNRHPMLCLTVALLMVPTGEERLIVGTSF